jgi:hypothetical protein
MHHCFVCVLFLFAVSVARADVPKPVVESVRKEVEPILAVHPKDLRDTMARELELGARVPAMFKTPARVKAFTDPWGALTDVEAHGLKLASTWDGADATKLPTKVGDTLDECAKMLGRGKGERGKVPKRTGDDWEALTAQIEAVLDAARKQRDSALNEISADDLKYTFAWPTQQIKTFGPQLGFDDNTKTILRNDRAFCFHCAEKTDSTKFLGAAHTLLALADADFLAALAKAAQKREPLKEKVEGVTGDLLLVKETRHGLILIGGRGVNTYETKKPIAVIVDLGGDDVYKGTIASSFDVEHPFGVVIDVAGNDRYEATELGCATGRLGCGLLVDLAGNDRYTLAPGSGGCGFGGVGILIDAGGDDTYEGTVFTQGVAMAGIGLLIDLTGKDKYSAHGLSIGLGMPAGVGAVIDASGDDEYLCGKKIPSGYNQSDAPNAKPTDPEFQFDAFGMGMGLGRRVVPPTPESNEFQLAGGFGIVIDIKGNDRYESSNFSQACGYFFGTGIKLDLAGDDEHIGARYGHASGAHFGLGLFVDYAGKDTYSSTGPTYNCGCAWDHSAFLCIDAGDGHDTYNFDRTAGLGRADIGSWGVFADLGGKDRYRTRGGFGSTTNKSLAAFFDASGDDEYPAEDAKSKDFQPGNKRTHHGKDGQTFVDR